jgi:hypothetical protein
VDSQITTSVTKIFVCFVHEGNVVNHLDENKIHNMLVTGYKTPKATLLQSVSAST